MAYQNIFNKLFNQKIDNVVHGCSDSFWLAQSVTKNSTVMKLLKTFYFARSPWQEALLSGLGSTVSVACSLIDKLFSQPIFLASLWGSWGTHIHSNLGIPAYFTLYYALTICHHHNNYNIIANDVASILSWSLALKCLIITLFFSDHFLNDFLVTFPIFMTTEVLCSELLSKYPFH